MGDRNRLVEATLQLDVGGKFGFELVEQDIDGVAHLEDVLAILLVRRDEDRRLAIVTGNVVRLVRRPGNLGDIADLDHRAAMAGNHRVGNIFQGLEVAGRLHVEAPGPGMDRADGNGGAFRLQGIGDRRGRQAQGRQPAEVEGDPDFGAGLAPKLGLAHAIHPVEHILEDTAALLQFTQGGGFRDQGDLHEIGHAGLDLLDVETDQPFGQGSADRVDLPHHLVEFPLGIRTPVEMDDDIGRPVAGFGFDLVDIVEAGNRILDRIGHQFFHIERIGARHDGDHRHDRGREIRVLRPRDRHEGRHPHGRQHGEKHQGELPLPDRECADSPHDPVPVQRVARNAI